MSTDDEQEWGPAEFPAEQRSYGKLSAELREQLASVTPSEDMFIRYHPCRVRLHDGTWRDRVMVVEQTEYINTWGFWPDQDSEKLGLKIEDVAEITDSPSRLPRRLAVALYRVGETGMGYCLFRISYQDGSRSNHISGNVVDFPTLPAGKSFADIKSVMPHEGASDFIAGAGRYQSFDLSQREQQDRMRDDRLPSADHVWCIYSR